MSSQKDYEAQRAQLQATLENLDASGGNGGADPAALPSASSTAKRRPRTSPAQTSSHHKKREQGWVTHTTSKCWVVAKRYSQIRKFRRQVLTDPVVESIAFPGKLIGSMNMSSRAIERRRVQLNRGVSDRCV